MTIVRRSLAPTAVSTGAQPVDADLTTIAALDSTTAGALATDGGGWIRKSYAQLKTALSLTKSDVGLGSVDNTADTAKPVSTTQQTALDGKQPLDADLTTIAALTATTDNVIQSVAGAWASRTPAQVKTVLALNNVDNTSDANAAISTATQTALDGKQRLDGNMLTVGEETLSRDNLISVAVATSNSSVRLTYFTARKTETTTQVRIPIGNTVAAATPTLVRLGLYQIDGAGAGTLVASIANDTTIFATANVAYTRSWTTPFAKTAGQRYALGVLVVTGAATPTLCGLAMNTPGAAEALIAPTRCGLIGGQSDLPASFVAAGVSASGTPFYAAVLP